MRALAHPARLAILEHLTVNQVATATECAEVVELSPSATSYHLRMMAKAGLIEEAPSRGDGRERVWQRRHRSYEVAAKDELHREEELAMAEAILAHQNDKVRRFISAPRQEGEKWWDVASINESVLLMTADELATLFAGVQELLEPYRLRNRTDAPAEAKPVTFQVRGMPLIPLREGDHR